MNTKKINIEDVNENYLQSSLWANVKKAGQKDSPWQALAFEVESLGKVLVLQRKIFKNYYLTYVAHPEFSNVNLSNVELDEINNILVSFSAKVKNFLNKNAIFIRYDLMYYTSRAIDDEYQNTKIHFKSLKKAFDNIQPKDTTIINLTASTEEILNKMKKKTRYNIKLSKKKNLEVIDDIEFKHFDEFYSLHEKTAIRDKFSIHSKSYLRNLINQFKENKHSEVHLIAVLYEGILISAIIIGIYKDRATYLYGASSSEHRNLMPNYAVQFRAIEILKEMGIAEYDLLGIPPFLNEKNPLFGLFQFKTGFGGKIIHRIGSYDFVYKSFHYKVYRILEKIRYFYYKVIKKRI